MTLYDACAAGQCMDYHCAMYGCRKRHPSGIILYPTTAPPQGCICPPTSEQTCQNPFCPRKPPQPMTITAKTEQP